MTEYELAINDAVVAIDRFQDIYGWQPGESRNRLVCEIRDRVRELKAGREFRESVQQSEIQYNSKR